MTRIIDPLAVRQLRAWEEIAETWEVEYPENDQHMRCRDCGLAIAKIFDDQGAPYCYSEEDYLALTVGHLRNHHPDLDPCEDII